MNIDYFGTGEYPYRSILHKTTCDSIAYWLKEKKYASSVIHNNNASFMIGMPFFPILDLIILSVLKIWISKAETKPDGRKILF